MLIIVDFWMNEFLRTSLPLEEQAEKDKPEAGIFYVQVFGISYQYLFWLFYLNKLYLELVLMTWEIWSRQLNGII
jgi:hypothetical protein